MTKIQYWHSWQNGVCWVWMVILAVQLFFWWRISSSRKWIVFICANNVFWMNSSLNSFKKRFLIFLIDVSRTSDSWNSSLVVSRLISLTCSVSHFEELFIMTNEFCWIHFSSAVLCLIYRLILCMRSWLVACSYITSSIIALKPDPFRSIIII